MLGESLPLDASHSAHSPPSVFGSSEAASAGFHDIKKSPGCLPVSHIMAYGVPVSRLPEERGRMLDVIGPNFQCELYNVFRCSTAYRITLCQSEWYADVAPQPNSISGRVPLPIPVGLLLGFRGEGTQRGRTTPTWCGGRLQTDGVNTCKL
jgi:hypothetical protein